MSKLWKHITTFFMKYYFNFIKIYPLIKLKTDYTHLKVQFGRQLKKIRKDKRISLRVLETRCDLDYSQISKIENAKWDVQLSTIFELAKGLGVDPKELLDFKI